MNMWQSRRLREHFYSKLVSTQDIGCALSRALEFSNPVLCFPYVVHCHNVIFPLNSSSTWQLHSTSAHTRSQSCLWNFDLTMAVFLLCACVLWCSDLLSAVCGPTSLLSQWNLISSLLFGAALFLQRSAGEWKCTHRYPSPGKNYPILVILANKGPQHSLGKDRWRG